MKMPNHSSVHSPFVEVLIEIKKDSNLKYEFDKAKSQIKLDRILYGTNFYPGDYGFIDNTLELDGDPIDVLIFSEYSVFPGCLANVKIVGGLAVIDDGEIDNKLIAVYTCDLSKKKIDDIDQVDQYWKDKVWDFFLHYKKLEKKVVTLKKWLNQKEAIQLLTECKKRFQATVSKK